MTYTYSEFQSHIFDEESTSTQNIFENLYFVTSLFDEISGPMIIFNNSPLDRITLEKLNLRVFSFLMQGSEFGPNNFAKFRGIVQIPQTEYYTSAIDIMVRKKDQNNLIDVYVPLLIYMIFPKEDIVLYAKIVDEIEKFITRYWERGIIGTPDVKEVENILIKLQKRISDLKN